MTNLIAKTDSDTISLLRMPMAFLVVLWHTAGFGISDGQSMSCSNGLFDIVKILFSEGLCIISVPIFFVISGYLFEAHFTQWNLPEYKNYIKRKLPKLIIPYFLWNVICFCVLYISDITIEFVKEGCISTRILDYFRTKNGIQIFAYGSSGYPIDYPLWFIRDLIFVYIFYPLLYLLNRMGGVLC